MMIDITKECTVRIELIGQDALIYIHLGQNDGVSREGAIGFFNLQGFHPMTITEGKLKLTERDYGWFKIEMDYDYYLEHTKQIKEP